MMNAHLAEDLEAMDDDPVEYATLFDLMDEWLEEHPGADDNQAWDAIIWKTTMEALSNDNHR